MNNNTKPHHKRASPMIVQAPWEDTLLTRGIGHPGFCNVEWPHVERFARSKIHASNSKQPKNRTREPLNIWISNRYPLDKHSSTRVYWLPRYSKRRQPHSLSLLGDRTQWKRHARNPRSSCWRRPVIPECVECRAPRIEYPKFFFPHKNQFQKALQVRMNNLFISFLFAGFLHLFGTWHVFFVVPFTSKLISQVPKGSTTKSQRW